MASRVHIKSTLIAPCGMNCGLCLAYLRDKNTCPGCLGSDENKRASCVGCTIKNCDELTGKNYRFCYRCSRFPCARMKQLDKRYRTRYGMSMLENLANIRENGIREFTRQEKKRWACPECGGVICVHRGKCWMCGTERKRKE